MSFAKQSRIVLAVCLLSWLALPGQCENWTTNTWGAKVLNQVDGGGRMGELQVLKEMPDLPQLPNYSGKCKLEGACVRSSSDGWSVFDISLLVKESPVDVCSWYQNAFNMYRWQTMRGGILTIKGEQSNGNSCVVSVNPIRDPNYMCKLKICFTVSPTQTP
jgi:hypothetical protein